MTKQSDFLAPPITSDEKLAGIIAETIYGRDGWNNAIACDEDQFHLCVLAAELVKTALKKEGWWLITSES